MFQSTVVCGKYFSVLQQGTERMDVSLLIIREVLCFVPWLSGRACALIIRETLCLVLWLSGRPCALIIREVFCPDYQGGLVPWLSGEVLCLDYQGGLVPWLSGRPCALIIREVLCPDYQGGLPSGLPLPVQHAWQAHAVTYGLCGS